MIRGINRLIEIETEGKEMAFQEISKREAELLTGEALPATKQPKKTMYINACISLVRAIQSKRDFTQKLWRKLYPPNSKEAHHTSWILWCRLVWIPFERDSRGLFQSASRFKKSDVNGSRCLPQSEVKQRGSQIVQFTQSKTHTQCDLWRKVRHECL